jgi:predicted HD phosphohydrolase
MGAILTQIDKEGKFYVISYASRKLVKHEVNYTPFLLEMHAAVWGMEHFSHHLKGKRFLLFTDHKPLEKLGKVHTKNSLSHPGSYDGVRLRNFLQER